MASEDEAGPVAIVIKPGPQARGAGHLQRIALRSLWSPSPPWPVGAPRLGPDNRAGRRVVGAGHRSPVPAVPRRFRGGIPGVTGVAGEAEPAPSPGAVLQAGVLAPCRPLRSTHREAAVRPAANGATCPAGVVARECGRNHAPGVVPRGRFRTYVWLPRWDVVPPLDTLERPSGTSVVLVTAEYVDGRTTERVFRRTYEQHVQ